MNFLDVIAFLVKIFYCSVIIHILIEMWQDSPITEIKRDHPLYITKELFKDD